MLDDRYRKLTKPARRQRSGAGAYWTIAWTGAAEHLSIPLGARLSGLAKCQTNSVHRLFSGKATNYAPDNPDSATKPSTSAKRRDIRQHFRLVRRNAPGLTQGTTGVPRLGIDDPWDRAWRAMERLYRGDALQLPLTTHQYTVKARRARGAYRCPRGWSPGCRCARLHAGSIHIVQVHCLELLPPVLHLSCPPHAGGVRLRQRRLMPWASIGSDAEAFGLAAPQSERERYPLGRRRGRGDPAAQQRIAPRPRPASPGAAAGRPSRLAPGPAQRDSPKSRPEFASRQAIPSIPAPTATQHHFSAQTVLPLRSIQAHSSRPLASRRATRARPL